MKKFFAILAFMLSTMTAYAGGLVTNTNMSVAYLRNPAREGAIDIDGIYFNPAGTAFLPNGIHASAGIQTAIQERNTESTFPLFALNADHLGQSTVKYKGKAFAPVIPMARLAYNWDRWNIQASFNIVGGGGKCKFRDGIGLLEQLVAAQAAQAMQKTGQKVSYSMYSDITGESSQFGIYLGSSYEIIKDHLAVALGLQAVYATNSYDGGLSDIQINTVLGPQVIPNVLLDCTQKGFGATPVIGIDYRLNEKFNISACWQFQTYLKMKTKAHNSPAASTGEIAERLKNAQDGESFRSDIPGYFMMGLQYAPIQPLRLALSYRYFDEKHAERENIAGHKLNKDNPGTHEACFGLEWDIIKYLTFSCGYQSGFYNMRDKEMSDLDFQVNSYSILMGFRVNINDHWNIDLGYMHSFYGHRKVTTEVAPGMDYTVNYSRKNDVVGIAVNLHY